MRRIWLSAMGGVVAMAVLVAPVQAQKVGDEVTPATEANLKVKNETVTTARAGDVLIVEMVNDQWLWVRTDVGVKGWVKADRVTVLEESAPPSPEGPSETLSGEDSAEMPADADGQRLYLIGALGGAHVYTTYAYIGVLADGLSKELYSSDQTKQLLGEVASVAQNLTANLESVRDNGLTEADTVAINQMIEIYTLLNQEANAAIKFTDTRTVEDAEEFDRIRTEVWPKISDLLGLEAQTQPAP